jgi:preprotein translocase subunit YajC
MILLYAALLQTAKPSQPAWFFPVQLIAIVVILYFLLFRPQQKQRQKQEETLKQLRKGDEVVTAGGLIAKVVHIKENVVDGTAQRSLEDPVTIQSGESRLIIERGRIARVVRSATPPVTPGT